MKTFLRIAVATLASVALLWIAVAPVVSHAYLPAFTNEVEVGGTVPVEVENIPVRVEDW